MIVWREKLRAFAIHLAATLLLAAIAVAVIFGVWYPSPLGTLMGGTELFLLVVGCDIALGPLLSLVIYDSRKTRRHLLADYAVIGLVQLAALAYGVWVVHAARPAYIVFNADRFEIVAPVDILPAELAAAPARYRRFSHGGPVLVGVEVPAAERQDALLQSVGGNEEHLRPKFYVPYDAVIGKVREKSAPMEALQSRHPEAAALIAGAVAESGRAAADLRWLPVRGRERFWTALVDGTTGRPVHYFELDPY